MRRLQPDPCAAEPPVCGGYGSCAAVAGDRCVAQAAPSCQMSLFRRALLPRGDDWWLTGLAFCLAPCAGTSARATPAGTAGAVTSRLSARRARAWAPSTASARTRWCAACTALRSRSSSTPADCTYPHALSDAAPSTAPLTRGAGWRSGCAALARHLLHLRVLPRRHRRPRHRAYLAPPRQATHPAAAHRRRPPHRLH